VNKTAGVLLTSEDVIRALEQRESALVVEQRQRERRKAEVKNRNASVKNKRAAICDLVALLGSLTGKLLERLAENWREQLRCGYVRTINKITIFYSFKSRLSTNRSFEVIRGFSSPI